MAVFKICTVCGRIIDDKPGVSRCREHRKDRRPSASKRGYGTRWQRTRRTYLRGHPVCDAPGCTAPATEIDHVDGLGPNGPRGHDPANLRAYCKSHHSQRTARDQPGGWAV
jgi:5-methylcytosine-specific restriction enzyme A